MRFTQQRDWFDHPPRPASPPPPPPLQSTSLLTAVSHAVGVECGAGLLYVPSREHSLPLSTGSHGRCAGIGPPLRRRRGGAQARAPRRPGGRAVRARSGRCVILFFFFFHSYIFFKPNRLLACRQQKSLVRGGAPHPPPPSSVRGQRAHSLRFRLRHKERPLRRTAIHGAGRQPATSTIPKQSLLAMNGGHRDRRHEGAVRHEAAILATTKIKDPTKKSVPVPGGLGHGPRRMAATATGGVRLQSPGIAAQPSESVMLRSDAAAFLGEAGTVAAKR